MIRVWLHVVRMILGSIGFIACVSTMVFGYMVLYGVLESPHTVEIVTATVLLTPIVYVLGALMLSRLVIR